MYVLGSGRRWRCVSERIGFRLYQFWRNIRGNGICVCALVAVVWVVLGESGWAA